MRSILETVALRGLVCSRFAASLLIATVRTGSQDASDKLYAGANPMTGDDIAAAILWVATLPPHLNVNVRSNGHTALAREIASASAVLLTNNPSNLPNGGQRGLPMDFKKLRSVAIIGQDANMPKKNCGELNECNEGVMVVTKMKDGAENACTFQHMDVFWRMLQALRPPQNPSGLLLAGWAGLELPLS